MELAQEEERLRAEVEKARAEGAEFVSVTEAVGRAQVDAAWAQESAVAMAKARALVEHAEFVAETYMPPKLHVFVLSGFDSYVPRRDDYDPKLVLRDSTEHLAVTLAEVYFHYLL